jgi:hypothetical protein
LDEVWPQWRKGGGDMQYINLNGAPHRYEPWPAEDTQLLIWLATSRAQAWIPTPGQLHQLWAERQRRANPKPAEPKQPSKARRAAVRVVAQNPWT